MIKDEQDILSSSGVERSAVNRFVVGSNPTWGDAYYMANLQERNYLMALEY